MPAQHIIHRDSSKQEPDMKSLIVLAIFAFAGCQANMVWQDQALPSMEVVKDAFWDYVAKATRTTEDILQKIRESEMGKEINDRISGGADAVSQYAVTLRGQMTPLSQELLEKIFLESEQLKVRLQQDLGSVKSQLEPYVEDLMSKLEQQVAQLKKDVTPYTDAVDAEALRATLLQKSEELRVSLEKSMKELQSQLGPQTEELQQKLEEHLQDFQKIMAPLAQGSQNMQQMLDPYAQDLKSQLTALWESFSQKSQ